MTDKDYPEEGDFVELTFEGEHEDQSPLKGVVREVDTNPTDIPATEFVFVVDETNESRNVMYGEGTIDGEPWANVTVQNMNVELGSNASWRILD